ncbi:MAG: tRNA epoxyqueuosine(34) reductase QueG [Candidatus Poribacteria bacterium]
MELAEKLLALTAENGFNLAGITDIEPVLSNRDWIEQHLGRFDRRLSHDLAANMTYLSKNRDKRADPRLLFPEAQSVLCVAIRYPTAVNGAHSIESGVRYARYMRGADYHIEITKRLDHIMNLANQTWITEGKNPLKWKTCVDTSAILEKSWAMITGLGWIGKNSLLINQKLGSYLLLGEILINQRVKRNPVQTKSLCGNCSRCIDNCPTKAISQTEPTLRPEKCISYQTLEKRNGIEIHSKHFGNWVAGCDICQEACPFNQAKTTRGQTESMLYDWGALLSETPEQFKARSHGSALSRIKPGHFSKNIAVALSNAIKLFDQETKSSLLPLALERFKSETDEHAILEWRKCIALF